MATDLSPSLLKVVTTLSAGQGLQVAPSVTQANIAMSLATEYQILANNFALANSISSARSNLMSLSSSIFAQGPIGFCSLLPQVISHIVTAQQLKSSSNFISNTSFRSYGNGITSLSSMSTQGLSTIVGNLSAAANAIRAIGPMFDFSDVGNLGTGVGFVKRLNQVKLGNFTGVNQQLSGFGIGLDNIDNPIYSQIVDQILANITNVNILSTVADQFGVKVTNINGVLKANASSKVIGSLKDFINLEVIAPTGSVTGLKSSIPSIAQKLKDMGANFDSADAAVRLFNSLNNTSVPNLDAEASTPSALMTSISSQLGTVSGTGNGPIGTPNLTDFLQAVAGGPEVSAMTSNTSITSNTVAALDLAITKAISLFNPTAGIDLANQPSSFSLSSYISAASSIRSYGVDADQIGINKILANMVTNDAAGESITSLMAEGKNNALLQAGGIRPLRFGS